MLESRIANKLDHDFIRASWFVHLDKIKPRHIDEHLCRLAAHRLMDALLEVSTVVIAVDAEEPDLFVGCVVYQDYAGVRWLHWAYTKKPLRRMGVLKFLMKDWPTTVVTTLCPERWQVDALKRRGHRPSAQAQYLFAIAQMGRKALE